MEEQALARIIESPHPSCKPSLPERSIPLGWAPIIGKYEKPPSEFGVPRIQLGIEGWYR